MAKKKFTQDQLDAFAESGRVGGKLTLKRHGKKHMSQAGKLGAQKRWENHKMKSTRKI